MRKINPVNIPTDILRTVSTIAELGSFSKAGESLGLSQPAISAQIKRLQILVGGPVFARTPGGVALNDRGKMLLPHIRRLLEINDRILGFGGAIHDMRPIRLGLSELYVERFFQAYDRRIMGEISITCDHSHDLLRGIADGYLDVACLLKPTAEHGTLTKEWEEKFTWVRSRDFVTSPGMPIPYVGWPGLLTDQIAVGLFEAKGLAYRMAFSSCDRVCRDAAVNAGIGVEMLPRWAVPQPLIEARDYYLPAIPPVEAGILIRHEVDRSALRGLLGVLEGLSEGAPEERAHQRNG